MPDADTRRRLANLQSAVRLAAITLRATAAAADDGRPIDTAALRGAAADLDALATDPRKDTAPMTRVHTDEPQYAAHNGRISLRHADTEAKLPPNGATTWWADGTTSYVLNFRSGHVHGWTIADEADTVIQAVDSLRAGEEISGDRLWHALQDVRRLRTRLEAVEAELILYARENGTDGRPRMPLREIGENLGLHHTTVAERHGRLAAGEHAPWRHWLVQGTARADMYGGTGR
ncbi:hypothetical protein ACGRHY_29945 [Streptomyces sp. HK10]|uniref:hypothetical protein n=1 Tax=Streptomyces sp. HK10 TaxID=3373255 RepID=UPI0037484C59